MKPFGRILIKILEVIGCGACVLIKILTDIKSRRVFLTNQKYSREWSLLHNITWSEAGNTMANVIYGGYALITSLMLIARCVDAQSKPNATEKIFLLLGMLLFFAMGGLVVASIDQIPKELIENAIILGTLSFIVGFIFLIDLGDPMRQTRPAAATVATAAAVASTPINMTPPEPPQRDFIDVAATSTLPVAQQPIFSTILTPEKVRPKRSTATRNMKLTNTNEPLAGHGDDGSNTYLRGDVIDAAYPRTRRMSGCSPPEPCVDTRTKMRPGYVAKVARAWDRKIQEDA